LGETGCWQVNVPLTIGMPFGLYTLTLDHPQGQISHQWGVDYPSCVNVTAGQKMEPDFRSTRERLLVSGLAPHQTLNLYLLHQDAVATVTSTSVIGVRRSRAAITVMS